MKQNHTRFQKVVQNLVWVSTSLLVITDIITSLKNLAGTAVADWQYKKRAIKSQDTVR